MTIREIINQERWQADFDMHNKTVVHTIQHNESLDRIESALKSMRLLNCDDENTKPFDVKTEEAWEDDCVYYFGTCRCQEALSPDWKYCPYCKTTINWVNK